MVTGYCPYGAGLCEHGGPACGKGFENLIECQIHYQAKKLASDCGLILKSLVSIPPPKPTETPED